MASNLVIVNTGCANISSVKFAFERIGAQVTVSDDTAVISAADKVLLPGVGSAPAAMKSIKAKQLEACLQGLTQPVLGVCLGMQLMVSDSQEGEFGSTKTTDCLNLIPGQVKRMQVGELRLPHMGWNKVVNKYDNDLFKGIGDGEFFYFVHSFAIEDYQHTLASCEYGGVFSAAIHKDNFYGVQFHPERSSDAGAHLLENFLKM
jgi:glutamine amidotransferase